MTGKHIEVFLVEGVPGAITTAEIVGWTGHVLFGPRSDLGDLLRRPEAQRNGVYLLLGDDDEAFGGVRCYIGRTESFARRFADHKNRASKEFFDRAVLVSAKDDALTEGHWGYLEARLVELARQAKRVDLSNIQTPQGRKLSEAQASDMEAFIGQLEVILPVLGVDAIKVRPAADSPKPTSIESPVFHLELKKSGVSAVGQQVGDEFLMLEGSSVVASWDAIGTADSTRRAYTAYRAQHQKLVANGSIAVGGRVGTLTRDIPFRSPSAAGAVALGRSCNGRKEWVSHEAGSYGDWEDRGLQ